MKYLSFKKIFIFLCLTLFVYFFVKYTSELFRVFFYDSDREQLIVEHKQFAKKLIKSFPSLPHENSLAPEQQLQLLFSLMLREKNPEGLSQLEMLYRAYDLPLLFSANTKFPDANNLSALYTDYRKRLELIGENAAYIEREDLVAKPSDQYSPNTFHQVLVVSDFQMRDEESPFLLYPLKPYFPTSYYPANPYVPYLVEDAFKTFRVFEKEKQLAIDLAIFTGDMTDNGHYNEVRWGIAALDGGYVNPDSGIDDDIFLGRYANGEPNDTSDDFYAVGLEKTPWYFVPGNHDGLAMGVFAMTYEPLDLLVTKLKEGTFRFMNDVSIGDTNYLGTIPNVRSMFSYWWSERPFDKVAADENRRLLNPIEIAQEMFVSTGLPIGHGMNHVQDIQHDRSYSFVTAAKNNGDLAIRHIALDTNAKHPQGEFSDHKMVWLENELQTALQEKQLVIVSSHHKPVDIIDNGDNLVALLNRYPNVVAHLVAHWHRNGLVARLADNNEVSPEYSYWEIETGSMVNWPQQLRILDIAVDSQTGFGHITTTMMNHHNNNPYAVSERGRFLAYLEAYLIGGEDKLISREGEANMRNTVLYFKLPKEFY